MPMVTLDDAVDSGIQYEVTGGDGFPELVGCQEPRLFSYPDTSFPLYNTSLADDGMDLAEVMGYDLLPWQEDLIRRSLGMNERDRWLARDVMEVITRQQGKTVTLEVREAIGLFLKNERIFHTSQQAKTNSQAWLSLRNRIFAIPDLAELMEKPRNGGEEVSLKRKTLKAGDPGGSPGDEGGFVRYIARSGDSGRGFTKIDLIVFDEAYALTDMELGALAPTQSASRNPQTWFVSSAGTEDSAVLARVREIGIQGADPKLLFAEWSLPEGADPGDRLLWPVAKPSLGADFCTVENLESDFMKMDFAEFAREHMGMWDDPRVNSVIPLDAWSACCLDDLPDGSQPHVDVSWTVAAVDVAPDRAWASVVLAGRRLDGRSHVEVVARDNGTQWVVPLMQRLMSSSMPPKAVALQAGGQAGAFHAELEQIGYKVYMLSPQEIAASTAQFYDDVTGGRLTHLDDESLVQGLAGAAKYPIGRVDLGGWGWLRRGTSVDITGVVACSYANRVLMLESTEQAATKKKRYRMG